MDPGVLFTDREERRNNAEGLGQRGSESRAGRTETEISDKQVIQGNIQHAGYRDKIHRAFGIAQTAEDRADDIICCDKRNSDKADRQILHSSRCRFLWCTDKLHDPGCGDQQTDGEDNCQSQK